MDKYSSRDNVDAPARRLLAITPSDATPLAHVSKGIYVGSTGNIAIQCVDDADAVTLLNVPAGSLLPIRATKIKATGTTASGLVALY